MSVAVAGGWRGGQRQRGGQGHLLDTCPGAFRVPGSPMDTQTYLVSFPWALCGSRAAWGESWNDSGLRGLAVPLKVRFI